MSVKPSGSRGARQEFEPRTIYRSSPQPSSERPFEELRATVTKVLQEKRASRERASDLACSSAELPGTASAQPGTVSSQVIGQMPQQIAFQQSVRMIDNIKLDKPMESRVWTFLRGPFELIMSVVIVINAMTLFVGFQYSGLELGAAIGAVGDADVWEGHTKFFFVVDHCFQALYTAELLLRLCCLRATFFYDEEIRKWEGFNMFDLVIVFLGCLDMYILPQLGSNASNFSFLRVVRLARLTRTLRVVRKLRSFSKVRVLIGTVGGSLLALSWSMLFLLILMVLAACFVSQQLQSLLSDSALDMQMQRLLWGKYGTSTRSFWTIFEITLGSQGTSPAREIINVHWSFTLFFLLYVSGVVFAVLCIIQAMFLKDTLEVAASDSEAMVQESLIRRGDTIKKLEQVFLAADTSGDGYLSLQEFEDILSIPQVKHYLQLLELDFSEAQQIFAVMDNGDNQMDYDEFIDGVMRLKGQARTMDLLCMMRDIKRTLNRLDCIEATLDTLRDPQSSTGHAERPPEPILERPPESILAATV